VTARMEAIAWPWEELAQAAHALAARARGAAGAAGAAGGARFDAAAAGPAPEGSADVGRWLCAMLAPLEVEVEPASTLFAERERLVRDAGPALLRIVPREGDAPGVLPLLAGGGRRVRVLGRDGRVHRIAVAEVAAALGRAVEAPLEDRVDRLVSRAGLRPDAAWGAREAILRQWVGATEIRECWLLRPAPGASLLRLAGDERLGARLVALAGSHFVQYVLVLAAWFLIGRAILVRGRLEEGWLLAWGLLLLTIVPFRMATTWLQGTIAIRAGGLLKRRLLAGALRLSPDEVRDEGSGRLLGRVMEAESVEQFALSGAHLALVGVIEVALSAFVIASGAGGLVSLGLFGAWTAALLLLGVLYYRGLARWTDQRLALTDDLVERMVGHRTRLAQQVPRRWHDGEDEALEQYVRGSRALDRRALGLNPLVPRSWPLAGLAGLAPAFLGGGADLPGLAIGVLGVFLGHVALARLGAGITYAATALVTWRRVGPVFRAAARPVEPTAPRHAVPRARRVGDGEPLLEARDVHFRHQGRPRAVIRGASLVVHPGERVLVEGPSGGGKSTLASILLGLRKPASGLLLCDGLDRDTLGREGWQRRVTAAAQFHENHVLTGSFAFNALLGRRWPAEREDLEEVDEVCRELGLGELIDRMPGGVQQPVGETGWQLSHGEKSRLYVARALLQGADLVILDESFASLDPDSLRRSLECVRRRARSLLLIAHP